MVKWLSIIFLAIPLFAHTQVLHDQEGNRIAVWTEITDGGTLIKSSTYLKQYGQWLPATFLSSQDRSVTSYPTVALNTHQQVVVAWESYDPTLKIHCIESVRGKLGQGWSAPDVVSEMQENAQHADCQVTIDDHGQICLTWSAFFLGHPEMKYVRNACSDFDHHWRDPETLS